MTGSSTAHKFRRSSLKLVAGEASVMGSHRISHEPDHVVQSYLRHHIRSPESFISHIDANDEMFLFDLQANQGNRRRTAIGYYVIGSRIFDSIRQIAVWHLQGLKHVGSFLDFACGYGRSTRFLSRELSPSRIWACDIYSEAVEFQKVHYGVNGIVSVPDPTDFPRDVKFDFIFASSFFTHMPETTFTRWLETLYSLLTPRGILVFSTHDTSLLPSSGGARPKGICFVPISESRTLDKNQYGVTYVDEQFVTQIVNGVTRGRAHLHRIERGLVGFQDLYILANGLNRAFSDLDFVHDPSGSLDSCQFTPVGEAILTGWATDLNAGGSIEGIQFLSNGETREDSDAKPRSPGPRRGSPTRVGSPLWLDLSPWQRTSST